MSFELDLSYDRLKAPTFVKLAVCGGLPRTPENTVWYRLIDPLYLPHSLGKRSNKEDARTFQSGTTFSRT
jgi:hypothetical protein